MPAPCLPYPELAWGSFASIPLLYDPNLAVKGVLVCFTGRAGGVSKPPYNGLNLGFHVGDDDASILSNRALLAQSLADLGRGHGFNVNADDLRFFTPQQVHGNKVTLIDSSDSFDAVRSAQDFECFAPKVDALIAQEPYLCPLLCFADCVSVCLVSSTGRLAVAHAGWRGVAAGIVNNTLKKLVSLDVEAGHTCAEYNIYIGPHISSEAFEVSSDLASQFRDQFGYSVCLDEKHIDLFQALCVSLQALGVDERRIVDARICTYANPDDFFSYRASGGVCGRHAALACQLS